MAGTSHYLMADPDRAGEYLLVGIRKHRPKCASASAGQVACFFNRLAVCGQWCAALWCAIELAAALCVQLLICCRFGSARRCCFFRTGCGKVMRRKSACFTLVMRVVWHGGVMETRLGTSGAGGSSTLPSGPSTRRNLGPRLKSPPDFCTRQRRATVVSVKQVANPLGLPDFKGPPIGRKVRVAFPVKLPS
jgi:hypothetical protein